jgi:hypothetical protein
MAKIMKHGVNPLFLCVGLFLAQAAATLAGEPSPAGPAFSFATIEQGRKLLTARDDFVSLLSPFDRAARMKTAEKVSEQDYLRFVSNNVLGWDSDGQAFAQSVLSNIQPRLTELSLPFPETIYFVETTGVEEGDASYTRANAIILPRSVLEKKDRQFLREVIAHELFHVLSRKNPELREKLYAIIGFQPCGEIIFPTKLAATKLTNPDAPKNDHCIRLGIGDTSVWAVPIIFSRSAHYDADRGDPFFSYLRMQFLIVDRKGPASDALAAYDPSNPRLLSENEVSGFYEQVGRNTSYIIHPEEILADNFMQFVLQKKNVRSPEILQKLGEALGRHKAN